MSLLVAMGALKNGLLDADSINQLKLELIQLVSQTNQDFTESLNEVNQALDQVITIGDQTAVYRQYLNELGTIANSAGIPWVGVGGSVALGSAGGATVSNTNRTIVIPAGNTGANAFLDWTFSLAGLSTLKIGDNITLRLRITQSVTAAVDLLAFTLRANGAPVNISGGVATPVGTDGKTFDYTFSYNVTSLTATLVFRMAIKSTAPTQTSQVTLTWNSLDYYIDREQWISGLRTMNQATIDFNRLFPYLELPYIIAQLPQNGVDVSGLLTSYIAQAVAKKKRLEIMGDSVLYVQFSVPIEGPVTINANGSRFNSVNQAVFESKTNYPWRIEKAYLGQSGSNNAATGVKFNAGFENSGSVMVGCTFDFVGDGILYDHVNNFKSFDTVYKGNKGIIFGKVLGSSVDHIEIHRPFFDTVMGIGIEYLGGNNITIFSPRWGRSSGSFQPARCLVFTPMGANYKNFTVIDPAFEIFAEYAVRGAIVAGVFFENFALIGGRYDDASGSTTSACIYINVLAGGGLTGLRIDGPDMVTKTTAVQLDRITGAGLRDITIRKAAGTWANSRGFVISNTSYQPKGNIVLDCAQPDNVGTGQGNTLLAEKAI